MNIIKRVGVWYRRVMTVLLCFSITLWMVDAPSLTTSDSMSSQPLHSEGLASQTITFTIVSASQHAGEGAASVVLPSAGAFTVQFEPGPDSTSSSAQPWVTELSGDGVDWAYVDGAKAVMLATSLHGLISQKALAPEIYTWNSGGVPRTRNTWISRLGSWVCGVYSWFIWVIGATKWISPSNALDQHTRLRVHDLVQSRPGMHAGQIADFMGVRRQTVLYHLRVLEEHRLIKSRLNGRRRYYLNGDVRQHVGLDEYGATARRILSVLSSEPVSTRDLGVMIGISRRGIAWHLRRLVKAQVVEPTFRGTARLYRIRNNVLSEDSSSAKSSKAPV